MNELESRIQDVLNDPSQMAQIMQMAESLGLHTEKSIPEKDEVMMQQAEGDKASTLLHALIPCLPPDKQKRLQRAVKIGKLSQIAGFALSQGREME